jgi:hypothetical protein
VYKNENVVIAINGSACSIKMREKQQKQMPLIDLPTGHPKEIELEMISKILYGTPTIYDHVLQDLNGGLKAERHRTGANVLSAEQVACAAIVMKLCNFSYEDLAKGY